MKKSKILEAWTDGATSGNPGPSGWAVLIQGKIHSGALARCTNNYAELHAAFQAAILCPKDSKLTIVTDSDLVIGWLTGAYAIHHAHIEEAVGAFQSAVKFNNLKVTFRKTKGHGQDYYNNMVDRAARKAALRERAAQAEGDTSVDRFDVIELGVNGIR